MRRLQILFESSFNRVEFALPEHVVTHLTGTASDCRFTFDVSQNTGYGVLALDGGGFVAEAAP